MAKKKKAFSAREYKAMEYTAGAMAAAKSEAQEAADLFAETEQIAAEAETREPLPDRPADELTPQEIIADAIDEEELALWAETEKLGRFAAKPLLRMANWAFTHRRSRLALNIATFNWGLSAGNMARAVTRHREYFDGRVRSSATDLRMLFVLGQLNASDDKHFYKVWRENQSILPWEMQRLVTIEKRKNAKPKPKKIRTRARAIHKARSSNNASVEIVTEDRAAFEDVVEGASYKVLLAPDSGGKENGDGTSSKK